jgi:hypothetical protein
MKIGVISDTHIPYAAKEIPFQVLSALEKVDLIVHAGDYAELSVLEALRKLNHFKGVYGNMDPASIRKELPAREILELENFKIGIMHGYGSPRGLRERIKSEFHEKPDVIIYGHSHRPKNEIIDGILYFNPGSPTDKNFALFNSFGILMLEERINGKIVKI